MHRPSDFQRTVLRTRTLLTHELHQRLWVKGLLTHSMRVFNPDSVRRNFFFLKNKRRKAKFHRNQLWGLWEGSICRVASRRPGWYSWPHWHGEVSGIRGSPGNLQSSRGEMISRPFLYLSMYFHENNTFNGSICQSFFFLVNILQLHIINYLQIY